MLNKWIVVAVSIAVGGMTMLLLQRSLAKEKLHFKPDAEEGRNFGEFPPEIPEYEFDGTMFV